MLMLVRVLTSHREEEMGSPALFLQGGGPAPPPPPRPTPAAADTTADTAATFTATDPVTPHFLRDGDRTPIRQGSQLSSSTSHSHCLIAITKQLCTLLVLLYRLCKKYNSSRHQARDNPIPNENNASY